MRKVIGLLVSLLLGMSPARQSMAALPQPDDLSPRLPLYFESELRDSSLQQRTLVELTLMRNWVYARAGNPFRKVWLREFFTGQGWYRPMEAYNPKLLTEIDRHNVEAIARYEASLTRLELQEHLHWLRVLHHPSEPEVGLWHIEGDLTAARLGVSFGTSDSTAENWTPLADPRTWDRQLSLNDLQNLSRRDLRILRNILYARRGRPFKTNSLQEYFATLEWYEPDAAYTDARLTSLDRRNIKLILDLEKKLGGPMTESELGKLLDGA